PAPRAEVGLKVKAQRTEGRSQKRIRIRIRIKKRSPRPSPWFPNRNPNPNPNPLLSPVLCPLPSERNRPVRRGLVLLALSVLRGAVGELQARRVVRVEALEQLGGLLQVVPQAADADDHLGERRERQPVGQLHPLRQFGRRQLRHLL